MHSEKLKVRAILGPDAASKPRAKKRKRKRFTSRSKHSKEKQRKGSKRRNSRNKRRKKKDQLLLSVADQDPDRSRDQLPLSDKEAEAIELELASLEASSREAGSPPPRGTSGKEPWKRTLELVERNSRQALERQNSTEHKLVRRQSGICDPGEARLGCRYQRTLNGVFSAVSKPQNRYSLERS